MISIIIGICLGIIFALSENKIERILTILAVVLLFIINLMGSIKLTYIVDDGNACYIYTETINEYIFGGLL